MKLIALDFWGFVSIAVVVFIVIIFFKFIRLLARHSEKMIITLVRTGMPGLAKSLLSVLIAYDYQTYQQSRFVIWNRIQTRFALLWGAILTVTGIALVFQSWSVIMVLAGLIAVMLILAQQWRTSGQGSSSFIQDVNERKQRAKRYVGPTIRQWDYLDEIFAQPT